MIAFLIWLDKHILCHKIPFICQWAWNRELERADRFGLQFTLDYLEMLLDVHLKQVPDVEISRNRKSDLWEAQFCILVGDTFENHEHVYYRGEAPTPGAALMAAVDKWKATIR